MIILVLGGVLLYRHASAPGTTMDAATILSPVQAEDGGTEPVSIPERPVLKNSAREPGRLAVDFGYAIGKTTYGYRLALAFAPDVANGTMDLGAARGKAERLDQFTADRRWSETRKAYLVAVSHDLTKYDVPSLCVRAVIGPDATRLDLSQASLCVMQRDQDGRCHPSTLACGMLREN
jgi:hypothetical protein